MEVLTSTPAACARASELTRLADGIIPAHAAAFKHNPAFASDAPVQI